jgi:hypothetical protein
MQSGDGNRFPGWVARVGVNSWVAIAVAGPGRQGSLLGEGGYVQVLYLYLYSNSKQPTLRMVEMTFWMVPTRGCQGRDSRYKKVGLGHPVIGAGCLSVGGSAQSRQTEGSMWPVTRPYSICFATVSDVVGLTPCAPYMWQAINAGQTRLTPWFIHEGVPACDSSGCCPHPHCLLPSLRDSPVHLSSTFHQ